MDVVRRGMAELPIVPRCIVVGAIALGLPGCVAGVAIGLYAYPPTAWAAAFEVGIPAAVVGAFVGFAVGLLAWLIGEGTDRQVR